MAYPPEYQTDNETVYTIDELRSIILPIAREYGMRSASLFGSYARGEATGESDIDVLVDVGDARLTSVFGMTGGIFEATGKHPDVFDISELLPGPFRDTVLKEAVPL